jgi:hypothetical protein
MAKKSFPIPISTIVTFLIVAPICYWTFTSYQKWTAIRQKIAGIDQELAALSKRNAELAVVYDAVQLKNFEVCNKSADQFTVNWVAAAFHDGKTVQVFDSDRCQDFKPLVLAAGDNKAVLLRSSQAGCNWPGSVMYYAMRYTQENEAEDVYRIYNMAGPYQGFDRDCYTFR